jgi:hypothetical protein
MRHFRPPLTGIVNPVCRAMADGDRGAQAMAEGIDATATRICYTADQQGAGSEEASGVALLNHELQPAISGNGEVCV